ncbi:MAG: hypothetical protein N5P05_000305 [Chroococcopsis gigantea SAG 12.99]|jgi:hypothetical protein|nr:hypothetical protein [Chroococcopsis gigantea SAG 12.99]
MIKGDASFINLTREIRVVNTQLVESIVQLIKTLSPEEQALVEAKLHPQEDWLGEYEKLLQLQIKISQRLNNQRFKPSIEYHLHAGRDERMAQQDEFVASCFTKDK